MVDMAAAEGVAISAMIAMICVRKQGPENYVIAWRSKMQGKSSAFNQTITRTLATYHVSVVRLIMSLPVTNYEVTYIEIG